MIEVASQEKKLFIAFLYANKDVFVWFAEEMSRIDHSISYHHLHLDSIVKLVIQRKKNHGT